MLSRSTSAQVLDCISHSPAQTLRFGQRLGELLRPGDCVLLSGAFGAGKTQFVKGIVQGLGSGDLVTSPSFVLVNEYRADRLMILHADLYRLDDPAEVAGLDLDDPYNNAVVLVEWADRAPLDREHVWIELRALSETKRALRFEAHGVRYQALVDEFKRACFG